VLGDAEDLAQGRGRRLPAVGREQAEVRFFSHDGQSDLPRQEKATSTLRRHWRDGLRLEPGTRGMLEA
jgi:hypothetical protein